MSQPCLGGVWACVFTTATAGAIMQVPFTFQVPSSISMPRETIPPVYIPPPRNSTNEQQSLPKKQCATDANHPPNDGTESHHTHLRTHFKFTLPPDEPDLGQPNMKRPKHLLASVGVVI